MEQLRTEDRKGECRDGVASSDLAVSWSQWSRCESSFSMAQPAPAIEENVDSDPADCTGSSRTSTAAERELPRQAFPAGF